MTGMGVLLPGCDTVEDLWSHLRDGRSQLTLEADPSEPTRKVAMGRIHDFRPEKYLRKIPERAFRQYDREVQLYLSSLYMAIEHAKVDLPAFDPAKVGIFDGCSRPMFAGWYERLLKDHTYSSRDLMLATPGQAAGIAASLLEVRGSVYTFNGSCSSGSIAIGHAFREVQAGLVDIAFATGHESALLPPIYSMYRAGNLLSPEVNDPSRAVRPYSESLGNAFGEAAITLVLEPAELARARGAKCYATLSAYGYANNGFHPTSPDLAGGQPSRIIREALEAARIEIDEVGFVVGHGNAVQLSDDSELNYMLLVFGEGVRKVPLISNKPIFGHTLGASSAINAAAAVLMLEHQFIAPTLNVSASHANADFTHMPDKGESRVLRAGLTMSFGLGGNNTVLAFKRAAV